MARIILRKGAQWKAPTDHRIVHRFHYLARQYGSEAIWLPINGMLVTRDKSEPSKDFPYEMWLAMASYEPPNYPANHQESGDQQSFY